MRRAAGLLALVWLVQGCVPKARYLELEASYDAAVAERDRAASEAEACEAARRDETDRARDASGRFDAGVRRMEALGLGEVVAEEGRASVRLPSAGMFAPDTADPTPEGEATIAKIAAGLAGVPEARFLVVGHTGGPPANTKEFPTAWHLGADRAVAVVRALVEAGVRSDRLVAGSQVIEGEADRIDLVWIP